MGLLKSASKAAGRAITFKLAWAFAPFLVVAFLCVVMVSFVLFLGTVAGMGEAATTQTVSSKCVSGSTGSVDGEGSEIQQAALANVPEEYKPLFKQAATEIGIAEETVTTQIYQESKFDPLAGSHAGAKGLAQFTDDTFTRFNPGGDVYKPEDAMKAYTAFMLYLKEKYKDQAVDDEKKLLTLMLAAYNAGEGNVDKYGGVPPFAETEHYVEVILGNQQVVFSEDCKQVAGAKAWDGDLGDGEWTNPCPGCVFTSGYGWRNVFPPGDWRNEHVGVDLATPGAGGGPGTQIIAPTDMKVVGFLAADGCVTTQQMGAPGFQFNFCHLDSWDVSQGQELKRGDIIGVEGGTAMGVKFGYATHLHLEIYRPESPMPGIPYNGFNLDPEPIMKEKGAWVGG